jgi:hypothetical protein
MTARQIRRAAERKARKAERKGNAVLTTRPEDGKKDEAAFSKRAEDGKKDEAVFSKPAEDPEREIHRATPSRSTGPRTAEGKAISSQNALKTALTGRTVLLPTDDRVRYERHLANYFEDWNPIGEHECVLVQALADSWWRLTRIPTLEFGLYAKGRLELTERDPDLLEIEIYLAYEKQFRNLALQERRLSNYAARLRAELEVLQAKRDADTPAQEAAAFAEGTTGEFEFSTPHLSALSPTLSHQVVDSIPGAPSSGSSQW